MRRTLLLLATLLPCSLQAQSTEVGLKARLLKKPLFLRGCWHNEKIAFNASGQPTSKAEPFTFTLSGIDVESVKIKPDRLKLSGHRVGIVFDKDVPRRLPLDERIELEILQPANQDYSVPLAAIFADSLIEMVPTMPSYWQPWAQEYVLQTLPHAQPGNSAPATGASRIGGTITAPIPLKMPDPSFSRVAHDLKVSGKVLVYLWVDEQGKPSHIRIIHPRGIGLDEMSLATVSRYEFKPATRNGQPVTVEMNVEINFQID